MYDMNTEEGQQAYRRLSKDQRAAYDRVQQQADIGRAEREMNKILNQRPELKSIMGSDEAKFMQQEAYGGGPLAEFQAMREKARLGAEQGRQRLAQGLSDELQNLSTSQAGQAANAYSQLAQSGGLSSGARERIAGGLGQQALAARQASRLQNQRQGMELESNLQQGMQDLIGQEASTRRGLQNAYMAMKGQDLATQNQFAQDVFAKKADVQSNLAKARMDAAANAYRK
jgi:hypothetical protein